VKVTKSPSISIEEFEMPDLIEAFRQMRHKGLIARRGPYCEHCGPEAIAQAVKKWRRKRGPIRGFVHIGEYDLPPDTEDLWVPLMFGTIDHGTAAYDAPGCVAVGEVVVECLRAEGFRYEWDCKPGNPIFVLVDESLTGLPDDHGHVIPSDENHRVIRSERVPESAFEQVDENPVRLLNLVKARRPVASRRPLSIGNRVKLGFCVSDALYPEMRDYGDLVDRIQLESMWVEVTSVAAEFPKRVYRGELLNVPQFIDPAKLRIGSPVTFTADMVFPTEDAVRAG
jgi:hypothetical protein